MRVNRFDQAFLRPSVVAFGVFDGLHLGHQALLAHVVDLARRHDAAASILTFDPHPALVLSRDTAPPLIGTLDQRLEGLERLGIDQVGILGFDELSAQESASSFVERVLVGELGVIDLVVGDDVHFGRDREGDVGLLRREGDRWGFRVHTSPTYGTEVRYSSTAVRRAVADGDLGRVGEVLGRPFVLRGTVVHGDGRGAQIGFPTANLALGDHQLLPGLGIYAAGVLLDNGEWRAAAVSVGTRPQFYDDAAVLVEVHLPDFAGDLYDRVLDVAFLERLRGEARFAQLADLLAQMSLDVARSREVFATFTPTSSVLLG